MSVTLTDGAIQVRTDIFVFYNTFICHHAYIEYFSVV